MNGSRGGVCEGAPDKPSVAVGTDASSGQRPQLVCAWTESATGGLHLTSGTAMAATPEWLEEELPKHEFLVLIFYRGKW